MVFISLGTSCKVRESIDRYNGFRNETNFFDWVLSNFTTVLFVIQNIDHPEMFLTANKFIKNSPSSNNPTHYIANHVQLYFSSLHDFPVSIEYNDYMIPFLEKYKRRLLRLKNIIMNNNDILHFIHMIPFASIIPSIENIYFFIIYIQKINSNCKFYLHLLIPPELHVYAETIDKLNICHNVKTHYMICTNPNGEVTTDGSRIDLNWNEIYNRITEYCK